MSKRTLITTFLVLIILIIVGAAIYIGLNLSSTPDLLPQTGAPSDAGWTNQPCSGSCNSGSSCNVVGNPPSGRMWACYYNTSVGAYRCADVETNEGGSSCYLSCSSGWLPCGCDESACKTACLSKISAGQSGTHSMNCSGCQQLFTCSCSKPQITNTVPPTTVPPTTVPATTIPPTTVPPTTAPPRTTVPVTTMPPTTIPETTVPPTTTSPPLTTIVPPTTTIPETALISDEIDRMIVGTLLFLIGSITISFNYHIKLGNLLWKYSPFKSNKEKREDFESKF